MAMSSWINLFLIRLRSSASCILYFERSAIDDDFPAFFSQAVSNRLDISFHR
jgi:hypothetical protein